jgi:NTE family protein
MPDRPLPALLHQLLCGLVACAMLGCAATAPINPAISQVQPKQGYRIPELIKRDSGPHNHPNAMVLLAFSGGGTRAAALAYGVLEELRRTNVTVRGHTHRMLDEVDMIAGVSGGSFTALSYALYGERLFSEFEPNFLKRDVQGELLKRALNPGNWAKLNSPYYGRSELAADFYDEILFHGATYGDLLKLPTPAAIVTGTDLSTGARFEFSQDAFDLLCSDLNLSLIHI